MLIRSPFDMQIIFGPDLADSIDRKTQIKSEFEYKDSSTTTA